MLGSIVTLVVAASSVPSATTGVSLLGATTAEATPASSSTAKIIVNTVPVFFITIELLCSWCHH